MATLYEALVTITTLLAPFLPFLAEDLYQNLVRTRRRRGARQRASDRLPGARPDRADAALERAMDLTRLVASLGNAARKGASIPLRQPLPAVRVSGGSTFEALPEWASALIQDELNVKRVEYVAGTERGGSPACRANVKILGPKYGRDYPRIRSALQDGRFEVEDGRVRVEGFLLEPDEVTLSLEPAPGYAAAADRGCAGRARYHAHAGARSRGPRARGGAPDPGCAQAGRVQRFRSDPVRYEGLERRRRRVSAARRLYPAARRWPRAWTPAWTASPIGSAPKPRLTACRRRRRPARATS